MTHCFPFQFDLRDFLVMMSAKRDGLSGPLAGMLLLKPSMKHTRRMRQAGVRTKISQEHLDIEKDRQKDCRAEGLYVRSKDHSAE
jgi:hypothetical protein